MGLGISVILLRVNDYLSSLHFPLIPNDGGKCPPFMLCLLKENYLVFRYIFQFRLLISMKQ